MILSMTANRSASHWRELPSSVADAIEPVLPTLAREILETIALEVPEYARPLEGSFGRGIRIGVTEALSRFVTLIRDPGTDQEPAREVYVGLGRGELRQGRSLDSLQAAYRVGARVAWRRTSEACLRAGIEPEAVYALADAIFAYIDEISAESVEGYAAERAAREGERELRRGRLLAALAGGSAVDLPQVERLASEAGWSVPMEAAALACSVADAAAIARRLPPETLAGRLGELGCVVLADPEAPGGRATLESACADRTAALGPIVATGELPRSWREARATLSALESGALGADPGSGPLRAEEHLVDLVLIEGRSRLARVADRRLAPLADETEASRERLLETLGAHLRSQGRATEVAAELDVHPQTVRYRVNRLRELLGTQLDDPDARFELEIALRALRRE